MDWGSDEKYVVQGVIHSQRGRTKELYCGIIRDLNAHAHFVCSICTLVYNEQFLYTYMYM